MVSHHFFLAVTPKATARNRCGCKAGKFPYSYQDGSYKAWLAEVLPKLAALDPMLTPDQRTLPVEINVDVMVRKPRTSKLAAPLGDNDNYEKGLWDAMTTAGLWWKDDKQIVKNTTFKHWAAPDEPEGYVVTVDFLEPHDVAA